MRMISSRLCIPIALSMLAAAEGGNTQFNPMESLFTNPLLQRTPQSVNFTKILDIHAPTQEEREAEREARRMRQKERNQRVKETMQFVQPDGGSIEKVSLEEFQEMQNDHPSLRKLAWGSGGKDNAADYADPGDSYDMWQQAYRMLGGFIDCDHHKDEEDSHDDNEDGGGENGCSRWMLWASYIDPNYQGGGYDEYFGDEATGSLDCHNPNTDWILMGVYRQEFYQYIEQISKHLWAIDEYDYVVALAGLAYMTDYDCFYVGASNDGSSIYAGVAPKEYGKFEMALYTDDYCLYPNDDLDMTFDDFGLYSNIQLSSQDGDDASYTYATEWWQNTQEYKLELLNDVYEQFKYCTSCIDYPTYQDGYYIGDTGTDDDDLINQCWKFYSHDSFNCEADCIALAHSQGTILSVNVGDKRYGQVMDGFWDAETAEQLGITGSKANDKESQLSRVLANAFVTISFIVFVATFLAFAVARRSRYRESRSSKSRRLLDGEERSPRSRSSRRSKSRRRGGGGEDGEGDGLFRTSGRKARSKSSNKKQRSRSRGASDRDDDYEPPRRSKRGSSRHRSDDY